MAAENNNRDYANMTIEEMVKSIIRDSKIQGTVTMPLRRDGYHTCANVMFVEEV